jgi:hypothetical protein
MDRMAKKRQTEEIDPIAALERDDAQPAPGPQGIPARARASEPRAVLIELPVAEIPDAQYISNHVEVNRLTDTQRTAIRRLKLGLHAADERLENNDAIDSDAKAIRWLLERIAQAAS